MAFAVEKFASIAQNYIPSSVASNYYNRIPFVTMLGAFGIGNQNKDVLELGRPGNKGLIIGGRQFSPAERLELGTVNSYRPRVQGFTTSNSKHMAAYDTMPDVSNPTTAAHSMATQFAALFYWTELVTPILIQHEDKIRAGNQSTKRGQGISMGKIIEEATEVAMQEHLSAINTDIWSGNPSNQATDPWDAACGLAQVLSATNTYGNINRTTESNTNWRAKVNTTQKAVDIVEIMEKALYTDFALNIIGPSDGKLILTNPTLYTTFRRQISAAGGVVLQNGMPEMAQMGVRMEVLQKDNCYIAFDPTCPANQVLVLTPRTFRLALHPERSMLVTPFKDQTEYGTAPQDVDKSYIRTRFMFSCDNPGLNGIFTAVGT